MVKISAQLSCCFLLLGHGKVIEKENPPGCFFVVFDAKMVLLVM